MRNQNRKVMVLSGREVRELLTMKEALKAVEDCFRLKAEGKDVMPPKLYLELPQLQGDFRAMPAYIEGAAGVKWVSVYPDNRNRGLSTVLATIILNDPTTGYPLAVMDGMYITSIRTGAAGGVAVKYLARKDSRVIGMIGAGAQARTQLMAIKEVLPDVQLVKAYDVSRDAVEAYAREMAEALHVEVKPVATVEAAADADIVVTVTPARQPVIKTEHIKPGTHINAIGADAPGKEEIEPELLKKATIVVDDIEQASHSGEINVPFAAGKLTLKDIHASLGEVVAGMKPGRTNDREITVFDSTGLAIEDIACARLVYEKARTKPGVTSFDLLG